MKQLLTTIILIVASLNANCQSDSATNAFLGKYIFPSGSIVEQVTVANEGGSLVMISDRGTSALEKTGEDTYTIVAYSGVAKFIRDADKKVTGITIDAMGYHLEGVKEAKAIAFAPSIPLNFSNTIFCNQLLKKP